MPRNQPTDIVTSVLPNANAKGPMGCTHFKLRQLLRQVNQLYDAEMAKCELKTSQYSLLSHLLHLGPVRPGVLAKAMTVDASTLTRNLKPLQEAGFVIQSAGDDGRSRRIDLTDAGRQKRREAQRHWKAAQTRLNSLLGDPQVAALHRLIESSLVLLDER